MEMVGGDADVVPGFSSYGWAGLWSTLASLLFLWSVVQEHLPFQLEDHMSALARRAVAAVSPYVTITIDEHAADSFGRSEAYLAAEAYLGATCAGHASRLRAELWSACGGERIIVFTTNHKDKLDPALIRRGRMDMHIEMSYCCFQGFKVLAKNYLGVQDDHELFTDIRQLLEEVDMTPADVAQNLMPRSKTKDVDACLRKLVKALEEAKEAALLAKAKQLAGNKDEEGADQDEDSDSDGDGSVTSSDHDFDDDEKSTKKKIIKINK
jgi:hypothetical protein